MKLAVFLALAAQDQGPNILFLFSDDQRFDTIRALGNEEIQTPTLDALVREGTAFTRAFIMGGNQGAVCVPSRAMMLTGRTLFRIAKGIPADMPMWPELFRKAGYAVHGIGKWHNGPPTYARCFSSGENIFFGGMSSQFKVNVHSFDPGGKYPKAGRRAGEKFSTELFADAAVEFLQKRPAGKPFVLYVAFTSPHDPRTPPGRYATMYDPAALALPKSFLPEHPFDNGEMKVRDEQLAPWPRTPEIVRRHLADYYGMISHMDEQIGRILAELDRQGAAKNTIVVFAGDNGLAVGRHGLFGKQNVYEHSVRVPLILRGPGIPAGKRSDAFCYLLDLFPTLCELAGVRAPENEGHSLVPAMREDKKIRENLFFAYRNVQRGVRDERFKLIEYAVGQARTTQLFDLAADPDETKNLAADPAFEKELARMRKELAAWRAGLGDAE